MKCARIRLRLLDFIEDLIKLCRVYLGGLSFWVCELSFIGNMKKLNIFESLKVEKISIASFKYNK